MITCFLKVKVRNDNPKISVGNELYVEYHDNKKEFPWISWKDRVESGMRISRSKTAFVNVSLEPKHDDDGTNVNIPGHDEANV